MSVWVTAGAQKWGTGNLDAHYSACKQAGVTPLVLFWYWGDDIGTAAIQNGVKDRYQGVWKTEATALALAQQIATKAKAAAVEPIVVIENEFGKNGVEKDASAFGPYFSRVSEILRTEHPSIKIAFCSAIWNDQAAIAQLYAAQMQGADMLALQTLLFATRHPVDDFRRAGVRLASAFQILRKTAPKPTCIIDLGFSSYGGAFAKTPPFAGGDGQANELLQAEALKSIGTVQDLEFVVYRALKDDPNFDVANYGGWAERFVGVKRADGTKKPAYDVLMGMAGNASGAAPGAATGPPPAPGYTQAQYDAAVAARDDAKGRLDAIRTILDKK